MTSRPLVGPRLLGAAAATTLVLIAAILPGSAGASSAGVRHGPDDVAFASREVLVRFTSGTGQVEVGRILAAAAPGARVERSFHALPGLRLVRLPAGSDVRGTLRSLSRQAGVAYAQPNYVYRVDGAGPPATPSETLPNDPNFDLQWGWKNTGQLGGQAGDDVDAGKAWDITTGSKNVVVAITDTGVQYLHPDLRGNMWRNTAECNGTPGVDDDGDGYVDDCWGIDTINHDSDPNDDFNHGTHLAGTIGAVTNNGVGVAGMNWRVTMIPCKSHDNTGNGTSASVVECMDWYDTLKQRGVDVVATNNSWGGCNEACSFDPALRDAITLMWHDQILFVASAGNDGADNDRVQKYPADYDLPNIIVLAATDPSDALASFSNWGQRTVTLGAPGVSIYSTVITGRYGYESGTSMSSPHVTGLLALLKAQDPSRRWATLRNLAIAGGEPVTSLQGITVSGLRMNAYNSLTCANRTVFGLRRPLEVVPFKWHTISVININCGAPAGHLSVTITPGSQTLQLRDRGQGPDLQARDGIYSASWHPADHGTYTLTFSNGQSSTVRVR